ncbi:MAG TPA: SusC/RagA family TonB-linked outer membrane protein [Pedobacter sp.]|uniref:SusC/RagA family TonB-linked outer membrane protein n=1 Tax=Pedobacter sp. TaxID=1411316 RepID=UPI002BFC5207|nr:SusC/RagA family TonB-linked outer membrane protein [Pedobacter sp.]HMI03106.1 SusC/RagA family TonB-linked outer membrane protein [Pedobacter sp.]
MKFTTLIMIVCLAQVSAITRAQINLDERKAPLQKVLKAIGKQSGYGFIYSTDDLKGTNLIDIKLNNGTVEQALKLCFDGQPLVYEVNDKIVKIKRKTEPSFLDNIIARFKAIDVKGRVVDQEGKPLPNASIQVKGKSAVTNTNSEGEFEIKGVDEDAVLVIRYVGYKQLEISLKDAVMPLEIKLNVATGELEEVKVVYKTGYQDLNKERSTGSFVQIDNGLLNRSVSTNILDRIYDVTSGLNYQPNTSIARSPITIRGISTINGELKPLIVVDGFPYNDYNLESINPNDIESVTVLKDAAAASIWGSRAGNGVIVLNTKKGKYNQQTKVAFTSNITQGAKPDLSYLPVMTAAQSIEVDRLRFKTGEFDVFDDVYTSIDYFPALSEVVELLLAVRRNSITQAEAEAKIQELTNNDVRNDIKNHLIQNTINQQYSLNISGGGAKMNYFGSVGYDNNKSSNIGDNYNRLTLRLENAFRPIENLELRAFISYTQNGASSKGSYFPNFIPDGRNPISSYSALVDQQENALTIPFVYRSAYVDKLSIPGLLNWQYKPLEELQNVNNNNKINDTRIGASMSYQILSGLKANVQYQFNKTLTNGQNEHGGESFYTRDLVNQFMYTNNGVNIYPIRRGSIIDYQNFDQDSWNIRSGLNYDKKWGNHNVTSIIGFEASESDLNQDIYRRYGYDPETNTFNTQVNYESQYNIRASGGGTSVIPNRDSYSGTLSRLRSYYANVAYTYNERYTLSLSGRQDGANLFGVRSNQKINPFWSAGLAWNLSNEKFYNLAFLPYLKLRATYGYNGNIKSDATVYPTITSGSLSGLTGLPQADLTTPGNPSIRWEKVRVLNLGLDIQTRNNVISGSLEYYHKDGLDLISNINNDPTAGFSVYTGNNASIKGQGIDVTLNSINMNGHFKWLSNLLFSYNVEEVTAFDQAPTVVTLFQSAPYIGKPLYSLYSYKWAGLDPLNGDPRGYIGDKISPYNTVVGSTSGVPNTKPEDLIFHGRLNPSYFGSLRNTLLYKNISLSFNIVYEFGHYFRRPSIRYDNLFSNWGGHSDYALRWQKPGDEKLTNVPSLPATPIVSRDTFYERSEILVEKADLIRLRDIRLSYDINKVATTTSTFQNIKIYLYASNLGLLWTANKKGIDPDFGSFNIPVPRTISIGLNLNF